MQEPKPFTLRPAQEQLLTYREGAMGVSAVPGSGKTFILSLLASQLVGRLASDQNVPGRLDDQEVLVVTFTNSAVANFRSRISGFLRQEGGLLPGVGYRVRTLHGLAHDIVRERPGLAGLSEGFEIIDDRTATEIKRESVLSYLRINPDALSPYVQPSFLQNFRSIEKYLVDDAIDIANAVIRIGKEMRVEPYQLQSSLRKQAGSWPLLDFGLHVFADYQRSLFTRGAVDFDDLIVLALRALDADEDYLLRLQDRWPYILEDEAQDSSALQEAMLRKLTARRGNWVRVGDPNQAINTTFTSADTRFLQKFIQDPRTQARELPNSGRCALPIIELANYLIEWSRNHHPSVPLDLALAPPQIEPTPLGDPQPNPPPGTPPVYIFEKALTPEDETKTVVTSLQRWLTKNPDQTVAILVPENSHGFRLTEELERSEVPFDDSLLRSDSTTRAGAQALASVLAYVANPHLPTHLETVWLEVWWPRKGMARGEWGAGGAQSSLLQPEEIPPPKTSTRKTKIQDLPEPVRTFGRALGKLREPEAFLFPASNPWLATLSWLDSFEGFRSILEAFRDDLRRWSAATILPIDELLLTLGNDLFSQPADLALTHHLAVMLAKLAEENPTWRLPELAGELDNIAQNKRRVLNFSEDAGGFEAKPGNVTVATMHASKGLEWDRVYLLAVNNFGFPSGGDGDKYRSERWYIRDQMNLVAEVEAQQRLVHMGSGALDDYQPNKASQEARLAIASERLRLLYVGITRARRELILTYNTGRNAEKDPNRPALAFEALRKWSAKK